MTTDNPNDAEQANLKSPHDTRDDHYPTRSSARFDDKSRVTWLPRTVPTVWGTYEDLAATSFVGTATEHARRGFTIDGGLLSPAEVQEYWSELEQLIERSSGSDDPRVIREPESGEVRSVFEVHRISDKIGALALDPRVLDVARALLGSEVYIHQSRINFMPGFAGNGFYWHSDFETWHAEDGLPSPRAVSLSIALTDNYPFNGGLMVIPESHRYFVPGQGETPQDNVETSLVHQEVGVPSQDDVTELAAEFGIEQFTGSAGSALWFDSNVMHGSGNNISPYPRSNIFLVFNSVENAPGRPFEADAPRPEYIASTDISPLTR